MQSLKEFVTYTKKNLSVKDTYALRANSVALGIGREVFVEGAGFAIAEEVKRSHKSKNIAVICGRGDKGAAGLATARHLLATTNVSVFFVGDPSTLTNPSTKINYKLVNDIVQIKDIDEANVQQLTKDIAKSDIVIDAIIGCGMHGRLPSLLQNVIAIINKSGKHIISVDIPSGIDGDTGMPNKVYVKAQHTFTAHKMKQGIDKSKFVGDTTIVDIGMPINAELFTGPGDVMLATEPRLMHANRYTHGRILVVGGRQGLPWRALNSGVRCRQLHVGPAHRSRLRYHCGACTGRRPDKKALRGADRQAPGLG